MTGKLGDTFAEAAQALRSRLKKKGLGGAPGRRSRAAAYHWSFALRLLAEGNKGNTNEADPLGAEGNCELDSPAPVPRDFHERDFERLLRPVIDDGLRIGMLDVCDRRADPDSAGPCAAFNLDVSDRSRSLASEVDAALQGRKQARRAGVRRQLASLVKPSDEMPSVKLREHRADLDAAHASRGDLRSRCRLRGYGDAAACDRRDSNESGEPQQAPERFPSHSGRLVIPSSSGQGRLARVVVQEL
jgi:hypothetical protein